MNEMNEMVNEVVENVEVDDVVTVVDNVADTVKQAFNKGFVTGIAVSGVVIITASVAKKLLAVHGKKKAIKRTIYKVKDEFNDIIDEFDFDDENVNVDFVEDVELEN